jgi:hypothetical protein
MGLDQAILQDGDRLLQAPIAGETIQPEHLLPHRAVAPKKGTGFGFVGNELVVALPEYGILVRTDRDAKEAQLCVPYWGRSLGAPMPTIGGFSVGIGRNANDLQTNRTYAYWAERPADSTGEYAVRRVELVR